VDSGTSWSLVWRGPTVCVCGGGGVGVGVGVWNEDLNSEASLGSTRAIDTQKNISVYKHNTFPVLHRSWFSVTFRHICRFTESSSSVSFFCFITLFSSLSHIMVSFIPPGWCQVIRPMKFKIVVKILAAGLFYFIAVTHSGNEWSCSPGNKEIKCIEVINKRNISRNHAVTSRNIQKELLGNESMHYYVTRW
jgi:hypothetical protein